MKIKKQYLLLLASIVWTLAGVNILKIGIEAYAAYLGLLNFLMTATVFSLFLVFVFLKLVRKHTGRILSYKVFRCKIIYHNGGNDVGRYIVALIGYCANSIYRGILYGTWRRAAAIGNSVRQEFSVIAQKS